jgi:hypothetical protein
LSKKKKRRAPASDLSGEEQLLVTKLLEDRKTSDPLSFTSRIKDSKMAEALAGNLPLDDPATPDLLVEIGKAFPQKTVQRAVKKTMFRLRQRGIHVSDSEPDKAPSFSVAREEPSSYVGPIDGSGNRPLFIAIPQGASGVDLGMGVINDEQGIIEFIYGRYSRKRLKEVKGVFFSSVPHMVETSLSHAATLLENAYKNEEGNPKATAREYLKLRPWLLENVELLGKPAVKAVIPPDSVTTEILTRTQLERLLQHELMSS